MTNTRSESNEDAESSRPCLGTTVLDRIGRVTRRAVTPSACPRTTMLEKPAGPRKARGAATAAFQPSIEPLPVKRSMKRDPLVARFVSKPGNADHHLGPIGTMYWEGHFRSPHLCVSCQKAVTKTMGLRS